MSAGTKSNVFCRLNGNDGETGVRKLADGERQVIFNLTNNLKWFYAAFAETEQDCFKTALSITLRPSLRLFRAFNLLEIGNPPKPHIW